MLCACERGERGDTLIVKSYVRKLHKHNRLSWIVTEVKLRFNGNLRKKTKYAGEIEREQNTKKT